MTTEAQLQKLAKHDAHQPWLAGLILAALLQWKVLTPGKARALVQNMCEAPPPEVTD